MSNKNFLQLFQKTAVVLFFSAISNSPLYSAIDVAPSYDPKPWLEDLEQTREALAEKYANLEWAVREREINLGSLFADAQEQIRSAVDNEGARAAFERLTTRLGDGHVRFRWPKG